MTQPYTVNSFDVCVQGFERLRSQSEFLLPAIIHYDTTADDLHAELEREIQACARPDGFNYDACRASLKTWFDEEIRPRFATPNPFNLDKPDYDEDDEPMDMPEGYQDCYFFVYVQGPEA